MSNGRAGLSQTSVLPDHCVLKETILNHLGFFTSSCVDRIFLLLNALVDSLKFKMKENFQIFRFCSFEKQDQILTKTQKSKTAFKKSKTTNSSVIATSHTYNLFHHSFEHFWASFFRFFQPKICVLYNF